MMKITVNGMAALACFVILWYIESIEAHEIFFRNGFHESCVKTYEKSL